MESFSEVFNIVKNLLRENLTEPAYNLWIEPLQAVSLQDNVVTLMSPSDFHCSTLQHNYMARIKEAFDEVMGFDVEIRFISAESDAAATAAEVAAKVAAEGSAPETSAPSKAKPIVKPTVKPTVKSTAQPEQKPGPCLMSATISTSERG